MKRNHKNPEVRLFLLGTVAGGVFLLGAHEQSQSVFAANQMVLSGQNVSVFQAALPLLQKSCFPCHVPGAAPPLPSDPQLKNKTLKELSDAVKDFQMGSSFPFPCSLSPQKQLEELKKQVKDKWMPPAQWTKLGLGDSLSDAQRQQLLDWIETEKKSLKK